jgi:hypothetical protein
MPVEHRPNVQLGVEIDAGDAHVALLHAREVVDDDLHGGERGARSGEWNPRNPCSLPGTRHTDQPSAESAPRLQVHGRDFRPLGLQVFEHKPAVAVFGRAFAAKKHGGGRDESLAIELVLDAALRHEV